MQLKHSSILAVLLAVTIASPALANDARSIALGGSAITHGQGVHGVAANPATLMHLKRQGLSKHFRLGSAADFRDPGKFVETALDNSTLITDIENNINTIDNSTLQCVTTAVNENTVCLGNTAGIGQNFQRIIDILEQVSLQPVEVLAEVQGGIGLTSFKTPIAVHFKYSFAGAGEIGLSANDRAYLQVFEDALIDGELTVGDIADSVIAGTQILTLNPNLNTVEIVQPQNILTSQFGSNRLDRRQLAFSVARTLSIGNLEFDLGVTPKVSSITTYRAAGIVASEFNATTSSFVDDFNNAETNTTSFTMDVGTTYDITDELGISAVIRNLIPESVGSSFDNFKFDSTPQLILGSSLFVGNFKVNADIAINAARQDGVLTQPLSMGAELGQGALSIRGGISVDNGRRVDKAAATLGFGLGPLQVGARLSSLNAIQASAQLSYSFR